MEIEIIIYGMLYNCPAMKRKCNCPFKELDSLAFKEKIILIKEFSNEEKQKIVEYHRICSNSNK